MMNLSKTTLSATYETLRRDGKSGDRLVMAGNALKWCPAHQRPSPGIDPKVMKDALCAALVNEVMQSYKDPPPEVRERIAELATAAVQHVCAKEKSGVLERRTFAQLTFATQRMAADSELLKLAQSDVKAASVLLAERMTNPEFLTRPAASAPSERRRGACAEFCKSMGRVVGNGGQVALDHVRKHPLVTMAYGGGVGFMVGGPLGALVGAGVAGVGVGLAADRQKGAMSGAFAGIYALADGDPDWEANLRKIKPVVSGPSNPDAIGAFTEALLQDRVDMTPENSTRFLNFLSAIRSSKGCAEAAVHQVEAMIDKIPDLSQEDAERTWTLVAHILFHVHPSVHSKVYLTEAQFGGFMNGARSVAQLHASTKSLGIAGIFMRDTNFAQEQVLGMLGDSPRARGWAEAIHTFLLNTRALDTFFSTDLVDHPLLEGVPYAEFMPWFEKHYGEALRSGDFMPVGGVDSGQPLGIEDRKGPPKVDGDPLGADPALTPAASQPRKDKRRERMAGSGGIPEAEPASKALVSKDDGRNYRRDGIPSTGRKQHHSIAKDKSLPNRMRDLAGRPGKQHRSAEARALQQAKLQQNLHWTPIRLLDRFNDNPSVS